MEPFALTVKNFRCFTDEKPLSLDLGSGFTAFIGPNNSGKSSALRFFYEFRHLLTAFRGGGFHNFIQNPRLGIGMGVIQDPDEVFSNVNRRDIEIIFSFSRPYSIEIAYVARIEITLERQSPGAARVKFFDQQNREIVHEKDRGLDLVNGTISQGINITPLYVGHVQDRMFALERALYIGAFRNAINQGAGQYYDLAVGTAFVTLWNAWKVGGTRAQMDRVLAITETIREIFGYETLEINAHQNDQSLVVTVDRRSYLLNELGSGLAQFIIVLGNVVIKEPPILLIDEPELNLHPALQQRFLLQLARYANEGLYYATHSMGLARSTATRIYSFVKRGRAADVHSYEDTPHLSELLGEMGFSAYRELGFDKVLLVEGVTDAPVFRQFLRLLKGDHNTVVIPLGGNQLARGGVDLELEELKKLAPNVFAVVDSERGAEGAEPKPERVRFAEACGRAQIPVLITARRATENYLSEAAIKECFGQNQRAFGPYETWAEVKPGWRKEDNWRIAAQMTWNDIVDTDIGAFLRAHWTGS